MNGQIHSASQGNIHVDKFQQQLAGKQRNNREADDIGSKLNESRNILKSARVKLNAITSLETDADFMDAAKLNTEQMKAALEGIKEKACSGIAVKGHFNAEKRVQDIQKSAELGKISGQVENVGKHLEKTCTTLPGALGGRMTHSEFQGMTFAEFTAKIEQCDHSISAGLNRSQQLNLPDRFRGSYAIESGVLKHKGTPVTREGLVDLMHELSSYKTESSNMLHSIGLEKRGDAAHDWHIDEAKFNKVIQQSSKLAAQIVDIVFSIKGSVHDPKTTNAVNASEQQIFCNAQSITPAQLADKLGETEGGRSRYELAKILQDLKPRCEVLSEHVYGNSTETDATAYMRVSSALLSGSLDTLDKLCGSEIVTKYNDEMKVSAQEKTKAEAAVTTAQEGLKQAQEGLKQAQEELEQAQAQEGLNQAQAQEGLDQAQAQEGLEQAQEGLNQAQEGLNQAQAQEKLEQAQEKLKQAQEKLKQAQEELKAKKAAAEVAQTTEVSEQEKVTTAGAEITRLKCTELPKLQKAVEEATKTMPRIEAKLMEKNGTATVEVSIVKTDGSLVTPAVSVDPLKFSTEMNNCAKEIAEDVEAVCSVIELNPKSARAAIKGAVRCRYEDQCTEVTSRIQRSREDEVAYNKKCQEETRVLSPRAEEIVNGIIEKLNADPNTNSTEISAQIRNLKATFAEDLERTESQIDYREACVKNLEALYKVYTEVDKLGTIRDLGDVKAHIGAMWAKMIAELNAQNTENQRTTQQLDNLGRQ